MMSIRHWLDLLFPPRPDELVVRGISIEEFLHSLAPKLATITRPETIVLFSFSNPVVRSTIHEAKYHGNKRAFELLTKSLVAYLEKQGELSAETIIVPVPLGKRRFRERGFNQVEEVVHRAAKRTGQTVDTTILNRVRETESQIALPRHAREENMRGAFEATRSADPAHTYIVVDDVVTTGATLQAAIDALKKAGAKHIIPLAFAH